MIGRSILSRGSLLHISTEKVLKPDSPSVNDRRNTSRRCYLSDLLSVTTIDTNLAPKNAKQWILIFTSIQHYHGIYIFLIFVYLIVYLRIYLAIFLVLRFPDL